MRNANIWFSCARQELFQLDGQLLNTLLSLGTYIISRQSNPDACRVLADHLWHTAIDPYKVKNYTRVWGRPDPWGPLAVIDLEPQFMPLPEQKEVFSQRISNLSRYEFLVRPATGERR
jgi:hypothetical protein